MMIVFATKLMCLIAFGPSLYSRLIDGPVVGSESIEWLLKLEEEHPGSVTRDAAGRVVAVEILGGRLAPQVTDEMLLDLGGITSLQELVLFFGKKRSFSPDNWTTFLTRSRLRSITFHCNTHLDEKIIGPLSRSPTLEKVGMYGCTGVTNLTLAGLRDMRTLRELSLTKTDIGDGAAGVIASLENLESLSVGQTAVGDTFVDGIQHLKKLRTVSLNNTKVSGAGVARLSTSPELTDIRCSGIAMKLEHLRKLSLAPKLKRVVFSATDVRTEDVLQVSKEFPRIAFSSGSARGDSRKSGD